MESTSSGTDDVPLSAFIQHHQQQAIPQSEVKQQPKTKPSQTKVLNSCTVGIGLTDDCHKRHHCRTIGLIKATALTQENRRYLQWRCGLAISDESTVCKHHEKIYIARYTSLQTKCCNPFNLHNKPVSSKLLYKFLLKKVTL